MNKRPIIIGICGSMGTGKDTVADYFVESYGFKKMAMADPLKHIVKDLFSIPEDVLWGPSENRTPAVRRLLQQLGTDVARTYAPNVWVDKVRARLDAWRKKGIDLCDLTAIPRDDMEYSVVISDIRFPNEAKFIHEHPDGYVIKVERCVESDGEASKHTSETCMQHIPNDHFYTTVHNDGTVSDLNDKLKEIYSDILVGPINDPS